MDLLPDPLPDPLSDVLSLLKPESHMSAGLDAGGDWAIRFPLQEGAIKCGAVVTGRCWLAVDGLAEPLLLEPGDGFLLPGGRAFRMASDPAVPPVDAGDIFKPVRTGGVVIHNGGSDGGGGGCLIVSCRFLVAGAHAGILLRMLPPVLHIRAGADGGAMRWSVERMMLELREGQPGGVLTIRHLAHMMLIQALRQHLNGGAAGGGVGWLFALADRRMAAAIGALHGDPAHRWTLQELAGHVGMSRSTFAARFKEMVGASPMEYLTRWRMLLAGSRLAGTAEPVSGIALSLGYESESAFSAAFKRVMGCSPREYGRRGGGGSALAAAD